MADEAVPLNSKQYSPQSRLVIEKVEVVVNFEDSLATLCRRTIVNHLERYPPLAFGLIDAAEWDELVSLKHKMSQPKKGSGGLDGTGRMAPAIKHEFMSNVEEANPSFSESEKTDQLVWRDCTEFRFRRGGLTRPASCSLPFPLLVNEIQKHSEILLSAVKREAPNHKEIEEHSRFLFDFPMSVNLLKTTGVGKTVKKILRKHHSALAKPHANRLESLLQLWMQLAANAGVKVNAGAQKGTSLEESWKKKQVQQQDDLSKVESCMSWRSLFAYLLERADISRSCQGKRIRQIRKNLTKDRPKVVKVHATTQRQHSILAGTHGTVTSSNKKVSKLRTEALITCSRRAAAPPSSRPASKFGNSGFANAVAFASVSKRTGSTKRLGNGKVLKLPPAKTRRTGR